MSRALALSTLAMAAVFVLALTGQIDGDAAVAFIAGILMKSPIDRVGDA